MCLNAIAYFNGKKISGTVKFHQCAADESTLIRFSFKGSPRSMFACHIHEYGNLSGECKSLGKHWNPRGTTHGYTFDTSRPSHVGDIVGNILFNARGRYRFKYKDDKVKLFGRDSVIGRSVVIHDGIDDLGLGNNKESIVTGNAGGRMECAIIGRAK